MIISNKEMNDIIKIVQALEVHNILLRGVTKTIRNKTKEQKERFLTMWLGTLGASLFGNLLLGKRIVRAGSGKKMGFLMLSHPLTNFEIQKYYENKPRFNGVFSRDNMPKK